MNLTSDKLSTPNDLSEIARIQVATAINPIIADAFALFVKTKNYHWHMSGSHYRDYHLLLDEHAEQIFKMIDILAERIRKLGLLTVRSISQIQQLQTIKDDNENYVDPLQMLQNLMNDNKDYATRLRSAHKVCDDCGDCATTSILENFIDETERRTWFLFETLS